MKKTLTIALICLTTICYSQSDSSKFKLNTYTSIGVSLTNSDNFKSTAYPSAEFGVTHENLSLGLIIGRGSFSGLGGSDDGVENYYYETKATASYPVQSLNLNLILGYGGYMNTSHMFIEYGLGFSLSQGKMSYGLTYSNWDGVNYISPCITFNF